MLTVRKSSVILLASAIAIAFTFGLQHETHAGADEVIEVTRHYGIWACGYYCGSFIYKYDVPESTPHQIYFHTGGPEPDGHDDGHEKTTVGRVTIVDTLETWTETCSGDECYTT